MNILREQLISAVTGGQIMAANRSNWIKGKNSSSFKKLFSLISEKLGSDNKALKYIPISTGTYYRMRDDSELTDETGRRILNAHKRLFKNKMKQVGQNDGNTEQFQ